MDSWKKNYKMYKKTGSHGQMEILDSIISRSQDWILELLDTDFKITVHNICKAME